MHPDGRDYLVFISSDGTSGGAETELECQGDLSINPGKSVEMTRYKNCTHSYTSESGFSASSTIGLERPLGTAQALLWAAHQNNGQVYAWIKDSEAGGHSWTGLFRVAITAISAPINGDVTHEFTLAQDGDLTYAVTT